MFQTILLRIATSLLGMIFVGEIFSNACPKVVSSSGQCKQLGQQYLYIEQYGSKGPSVVFESGRGDTHSSWDKVIPLVSQFAETFSYDRSGLGYSQASNQPATAKIIAKQLKSLLQKSHVKPPYILVGHSDGGLYVQMFARLYPRLVSAVVLVDSASQYQTITGKLPSHDTPSYQEAAGFNATRKQLLKAPAFPPIPLIVLTATWHASKDPNYTVTNLFCNNKPCTMTEHQIQQIWVKLQRQLTQLSPCSMQWYAYGSGHHIQRDQPMLVVDAIYTAIHFH